MAKKKNQSQIAFANYALNLDTDDCVLWPYGLDKNGYGYSSSLLDRRAHRAVFKLAQGPVLPGNVVMHACDNPSCVNPRHLSQGTQKENIHDMHRKGRAGNAGRLPDNKGELHGKAKLDADAVRLIRLNPDKVRQRSLAVAFGVSKATIQDVRHRRTWTHI